MPQFTRPFPPPPPPQHETEQVEPQAQTDGQTEEQESKKDKKLSAKTRFGLLIAGGVLSLTVATVCIVLIFIL